jgi:hypothetical protein
MSYDFTRQAESADFQWFKQAFVGRDATTWKI